MAETEAEKEAFVRVLIVFRAGASQTENPKALYRMRIAERDRLLAECAHASNSGLGTYEADYVTDSVQRPQAPQPRKLFLRFSDVLYIG